MKLWETYFRLWGKFSDVLTETQSKHRESGREDERGSSYYGYRCDRQVCFESDF
jgi:hypothetical protein